MNDQWQIPAAINRDIWHIAPDSMQLPHENSVHIWIWSQQQNRACVDMLRAALSPHEIQRAAKFYTDDLRNRYSIRWGVLRQILSKYLNTAPQDFTFQFGEHGKPFLPNHPLHFNASHSEDFAIMGISSTQQLGVDIEAMLPLPDIRLVAQHHFSPAEQADLFSLSEDEQVTGFYNCWTRKEAFIKVDGRGLSIALDSFDVTLKPDESPQIKRIGDNSNVKDWRLQTLPVPEGYKGAVAIQHPIEEIKFWAFALNDKK